MSRFCIALATLAFGLISLPAFASIVDFADQAMLKKQFDVIANFAKEQFKQDASDALTIMVAQATQLLDQNGFHDDANAIRAQWKLELPKIFNGIVDNVGDHAPLSDYLAAVYSVLKQRLGEAQLRKYHLDDINTVNYTAPVAFQPAGDRRNGDSWNQAEYTRHFVPFTGIVTYWTSYLVCLRQVGTEDWAKIYCSRASLVFKSGMQNMVAPQMASAIYQKANGHGDANYQLNARPLVQYEQSELAKIPRP